MAYTIDDIIEALIGREARNKPLHPGDVLFYVHMAYALGMGLQPSEMYAKLAELDRIKEIKGVGR